MEELLVLSTSENTRKVYDVAIHSFENFSWEFSLTGQTLDKRLTLYVTLLSILDLSPRTIRTYIGGIKTHYRLKREVVENEFLLKKMLLGVHQFNWGEQLKCMPILVQHLSTILTHWQRGRNPYETALLPAIIWTMFYGLLRVGEISESPHNLKHSSLNVLARHYNPNCPLDAHQVVITLDFQTMKTDQYGEQSQWIWFAKEEDHPEICPIRAMLKYLALCPEHSEWLFCDKIGRPLTHQFVAENLNQSFKWIDNVHKYRTHSLRIGGAMYLLMSGWTMEQIMARGHCKSSESAMKYCKSIKNYLQIAFG